MAGRSDIQAGSAYVRLWVKNNELIKGLQSSGKMLKNWGANVSAIGAGISAIGAGILAPLITATEHFASSGDEINKMSQRTGASVEALSELRYAVGQSGASLSDLETGFKHMGKSIDEARQGSKEARETFARLGISMDQLNEPPDAQLELFADRLSSIEDPSQRAALAMKVFGKSGTSLLPLFADGAKGIRALRSEAVAMGQSFGQDQADAATNLGDAWDRVKQGLAGAAFQIGSALAPSLTDLLGIVKNNVIYISDFVRNNKEMVVTAAKLAVGLVVLGGAVTAIGVGLIGAGAMLTGFSTTIGAVAAGVSTVVGIMVSGPGLIAAAVIGGASAFLLFTETGRQAVDTVVGRFWELFDVAKEAWGGIVNALMAGDLALAGQIALTGLKAVVLEGLAFLEQVLGEFVGGTLGAIGAQILGGDFTGAWNTAVSSMTLVWDTFSQGIVTTFTAAAQEVLTVWQAVTTAISEFIIENQKRLKQLIDFASSGPLAAAFEQLTGQTVGGAVLGPDIKPEDRQQAKTIAATQIAGQSDAMRAMLADMDRQARANVDASSVAFGKATGGGGTASAAAAAARDDLARLTAQAADAAAKAALENRKKEQEEGAGIIAPGNLGPASTGTFSAAAAMALGGSGGFQERIAKNTEDQKKLQEKTYETIRQLVTTMQDFVKNNLTHG